MNVLGARVVDRCRELARVSEERDRLTRRYATPSMLEIRDAAGVTVHERVDPADARVAVEVLADAIMDLAG